VRSLLGMLGLAALFFAATAAMPAWAGPPLATVNPDSAYPEGPVVIDGALLYAEMGNDRVMRFDGIENTVLWSRQGCGPTAVAPYGGDELVVLCHLEESVAILGRDGRLIRIIDRDGDGRRFLTPNAAVSDRRGGVYFSSSGIFAPGARAEGAVMHLGADGRLRRLAEGIRYANGVALSPDGRRLLVSEHLARNILSYRVAADGSLGRAEVFVRLDDLTGAGDDRGWEVGPDGLLFDPGGNLIAAEYGAGRLLVIDPAGRLRFTIEVSERYVTAAAFDAAGNRLFITAPASLISPDSGTVYETAYPPSAE
jgi:gluconolactonase